MKPPSRPGIFRAIVLAAISLVLCSFISSGADVSFYTIQKAEKYNQVDAGAPALGTGNPYKVEATVGPGVAGSLQSATIAPPVGAAQTLTFDPVTTWFDFTAGFATQAMLDAAAPSGNYTFVMNTVHDGQKTVTLSMPAETFPPAPHISNWTAGQTINPAVDFTLKWDAIAGAGASDYILVLMGNGTNGFRSPAPFQPGALGGLATSVVIPATNFQANTTYGVEISFFKSISVNSTKYPGANGVVGFSAFTDSTLATTAASTPDVSFYTVQKGQKYNQSSAGAPTPGNNLYRFEATVAPSVAGSLQTATVAAAGGAAQSLSFDPTTDWYDFSLKFTTQALLDAGAPIGNYTLVMNTVHDGQKTVTLNLPAETFPPAPHISNWTAGQVIDPTVNFTLRWDAFAGGTTNDYILVLVGDAVTGAAAFRSPAPFQPGALNGLSTSVVIPAANLQPGATYGVEVGFYSLKSLDTTSYPGAVGIVGFNAVTDSALATTGSAPQFGLSLRQFAQAGSFLNSTNATPQFPVAINSYRAQFIVSGTTNFASPTTVFFTGPPGSGLTNSSSGPNGLTTSGTNGFYFSRKISQPPEAPGGSWSVSYQGTPFSFTEPDPQVATHLIVPVPNVVLSNGVMDSVSWSYYDPSGNPIAGTPVVLYAIEVQQIDLAGNIYNSPSLLPTTSSYAFTNSFSWTNLSTLRFLYGDTLNNSYVIAYPNVIVTTPTQLAAVQYSGGGFVLRLTGAAGYDYRVQFSTDLVHWTDLVTTNLPSSTIQLPDLQAGSAPARFYRAALAN